jgi:hypothetical protein
MVSKKAPRLIFIKFALGLDKNLNFLNYVNDFPVEFPSVTITDRLPTDIGNDIDQQTFEPRHTKLKLKSSPHTSQVSFIFFHPK